MAQFTCDVEGARDTLHSWIARGEVVGVFQNQDFNSAFHGRTVYLPLTVEEAEQCVLKRTHAPDSPSYGLGWRYILQAMAGTVDDLATIVDFPEEA
jgi:hypothetical protein